MAIKKFINTLFISFLLISSLIISPVAAQNYNVSEKTSSEKDKKLVRVAMFNMPNFLTVNDNGEFTGFAYEVLMKIQKITDLQFQFIPMDFQQAWQALKDGNLDIIPGIAQTPERLQ